MKLVIQKTWTSEEEIEAPDGLTGAQMDEWLSTNVHKFANHGATMDFVYAIDPKVQEIYWEQ